MKFYGVYEEANAETGEILLRSKLTGATLFTGVVPFEHHNALKQAIRIAEREALKAAAIDCKEKMNDWANTL